MLTLEEMRKEVEFQKKVYMELLANRLAPYEFYRRFEACMDMTRRLEIITKEEYESICKEALEAWKKNWQPSEELEALPEGQGKEENMQEKTDTEEMVYGIRKTASRRR